MRPPSPPLSSRTELTRTLHARSVTSVGGTQGYAPEEAWTGSSGGFSNYYPTPAWQAPATAAYLARLDSASTNAGRFNASGRGFPDVAAKADAFRVFVASVGSVYGTSAASPTVASAVALLNDRLAQAGRAPLGFLNPWLYAAGRAGLNDVTAGNSSVECNGEEVGFAAAEGWDPVSRARGRGARGLTRVVLQVTGLGTPDFDKLLNLVGL